MPSMLNLLKFEYSFKSLFNIEINLFEAKVLILLILLLSFFFEFMFISKSRNAKCN